MKLSQVRFNWDALARRDALGSICTQLPPGAERWDAAAFFETGRREWSAIRARAHSLGLAAEGERALDFGCGVGRLSFAMAADFARVDAVDASGAMLAQARRFQAEAGAGASRVHFAQNLDPERGFAAAESCDFALALLVLQHVPPDAARAYLAALVRALRPGKALFAQIPERCHPRAAALLEARGLKGRLRRAVPALWLERYRSWRNRGPRMDMFGLAPGEVAAVLERAGAELLAADPADDTQGLLPSRRYFARRRERR